MRKGGSTLSEALLDLMMPIKVPTGTPSETVKISLSCWSSDALLLDKDGNELESEFESSSADETVVSWLANSARHNKTDAMRKGDEDENDEVIVLIEDQWNGEYVQKRWHLLGTFRLHLNVFFW